MKEITKFGLGALAVVGFMLLIVVGATATTIDPGQKGVKVNNGEIAGTVGNGLHFTIPGAERIRVFETRTSVYETNTSTQTDDDINVDVSATVRWDIKEGQLRYVYKNLAVNQEALVQNAVKDAVMSGITTSRQYDARNVTSEEYQQSVKAKIEDRFDNRGLVVKSVTIDNIEYPQSVAQKYRNQQEAEAQKAIAQSELEEARINSEKKLVQAENKREVIETRSESLSPLYVEYIEAKNIGESDTVYVVPSGGSESVEMTKEVANTNQNTSQNATAP